MSSRIIRANRRGLEFEVLDDRICAVDCGRRGYRDPFVLLLPRSSFIIDLSSNQSFRRAYGDVST
jgi:hypothetical protein